MCFYRIFLFIPRLTYAGGGVVEPVAGAFVVENSIHWFGSITFVTNKILDSYYKVKIKILLHS